MNLKSTLLTAALATTLLVGSAVAALAGPASMDDDAKLYSHPGWGVIGSVDEDDDIWVIQCATGYCFIKDDDSKGWVKASAIDFGSSDDSDDDDDSGPSIHLGFGFFGLHHHHP